MNERIRAIIENHFEIFGSLGLDRQNSFQLAVNMILLKFLAMKHSTSDIYDVFLAALPDQNETHSTIERFQTVLKAYSNIDRDFPGELEITNIDGLQNITPLQFAWMLTEWDHSTMTPGEMWQPAHVAKIFEILEKVSGSNSPEANFYQTPPEIVSLLTGSLVSNPKKSFYDPFARTGEIMTDLIIMNGPSDKIEMSVFGSSMLKLIKIKMFMLGAHNVKYHISNTLVPWTDEKFDNIVSNPPFGVATSRNEYKNSGKWSSMFSSNRSELDFINHIVDSLSENGCATIVVPSGMLSSGGKAELIRKEIINENMLESIIRLPAGIFQSTNVSTAIMLINRQKVGNTTLLIDSSAVGTKDRKRHYLSSHDVDSILKIIKLFRKGEYTENLLPKLTFAVVSQDQFVKENYDFEPNRYIKTGGVFPDGSLAKIKKSLEDCHKLESQISEVQKRISLFFSDQV
jgi:type I restriction-modification system DNA methylase subunit